MWKEHNFSIVRKEKVDDLKEGKRELLGISFIISRAQKKNQFTQIEIKCLNKHISLNYNPEKGRYSIKLKYCTWL